MAKEDETKAMLNWMDKLYDPNLLNEESLKNMYDHFKYSGFNREEMLKRMSALLTPKLSAEAVMVCALRGPNKACDIKLSNGKSLKQMGVPASGQKGTMNLSCARIAATTADLAASFFKRIDLPKRDLESDLPGWLQFATAGSIKMPDDYRKLHIEFSKKFSQQIGGKFDESIYSQMAANAYIDLRIKTFLFK
jgi:hypothetical protein